MTDNQKVKLLKLINEQRLEVARQIEYDTCIKFGIISTGNSLLVPKDKVEEVIEYMQKEYISRLGIEYNANKRPLY